MICYIVAKASQTAGFLGISARPAAKGAQNFSPGKPSNSSTSMKPARTNYAVLVVSLTCIIAGSLVARAQTTQTDQTDVVKVYTELVQTDVTVLDKDGHFADGLRREDFELRIDGKPRPIEFFERIKTGSVNEESQLAAARGSHQPPSVANPVATPLDRGRSVFFYIDDLHMDLNAVNLTRKMISRFIDREMKQNDEAAVLSSSGQIGFLQQLTDHRAVLRAALERLRPQNYSVKDFQSPPMTEYQAMLVDRRDKDTIDVFVENMLRETPGLTRDLAESMLHNRAQQMLQEGGRITKSTLSGLENLVRSSSSVPGRKLIFFISGGFFLDERNSDSIESIQRLTSAAARSGVVIYSMDARGLVSSLVDASTEVLFDPSARLDRASQGELLASQDALNALARDTGGRPFFNTNSLDEGLKAALRETSTYYLLAWKPDGESQSHNRFRRIEVKLINKPDLTVRVRRGFFDLDPEPAKALAKKNSREDEKSPQAKLQETITRPFPQRDIPIALSLSYVNTANKGDLLSTSLEIPSEFLSFVAQGDKSRAVVDLSGFVYNDKGRVGARFNDRVTVTAGTAQPDKASTEVRAPDVIYNFPVFLTPGIYQVRVGARDEASGKAGSAHGWIEIPNLSAGQLTLSSLLIGRLDEKNQSNASATSVPVENVSLSVDHRFRRDSYLRFMLFVYNAATSATDSKPDVAIQVQLIRDDQPVITTALRHIDTQGITDVKRLPYAADVPLVQLPAGHYLLQVTGVDRVAKQSASQQTRFEIY